MITGACGFAGSTIARHLIEASDGLEVMGVDNLMRAGSELNRPLFKRMGVDFYHGDVRIAEDVDALPDADWVIDAAANPSVLAGLGGARGSSRQLVSHNVGGTINVLEYCKRRSAGLILLSSSRVYSITELTELEVEVSGPAFVPNPKKAWPHGCSAAGVSEEFLTRPPISLYGSSKLCSEILAQEYSTAFGFPIWIDRLGVLAGAGQFGTAEQGIFSFWVHSCAARRPLSFIGFGGKGYQVRDCLHPRDLIGLLLWQMKATRSERGRVFNAGGGRANSLSLRELHEWCEDRFGPRPVVAVEEGRRFDVPWLVLDSARAREEMGWAPTTSWMSVLDEIARHAEENPNWLEVAGG